MSLKCDCDWLCVQAKGGDVWQGLELGQDPDWIWDGGGAREEATGTSCAYKTTYSCHSCGAVT